MSVELKGRLEKRFGEKLPATLTFNYPTITAVSEYLGQRAEAVAEAGSVDGRPAAGREANGERPAGGESGSDRIDGLPAASRTDRAGATAAGTGDDDSEETLTALLEDR